jgi:hypothetical protein
MKLHLVLHGLFAGVVRKEDPGYIELWIPSFPDHSYQWEEWGVSRPTVSMSGGGKNHDTLGSGLIGGTASLEPEVVL